MSFGMQAGNATALVMIALSVPVIHKAGTSIGGYSRSPLYLVLLDAEVPGSHQVHLSSFVPTASATSHVAVSTVLVAVASKRSMTPLVMLGISAG